MLLNGNAINLPTSVVIPLRDKFRARKLLRTQPLFFHVMLQQIIMIETLVLLTPMPKNY